MQLLKNIYQVGGSLNGVTFCGNYEDSGNYNDGNVYVLKTSDGLILFDSGNGETLDQIYKNMEYWSLDPSDIKACFITHPHFDHAGGCDQLKQRGIKLYAHEYTAQAIAAGDQRCCGFLYHKKFHPCEVDVCLTDEDVIDICGIKIKAMHYPGHSMGCSAFCFEWDNSKIVVSGDIIGTLLDGYFGWSGSYDFDKKIYLDSLLRFAGQELDIMLPGHGLVYFGNPQSRIETALNHALMEWR